MSVSLAHPALVGPTHQSHSLAAFLNGTPPLPRLLQCCPIFGSLDGVAFSHARLRNHHLRLSDIPFIVGTRRPQQRAISEEVVSTVVLRFFLFSQISFAFHGASEYSSLDQNRVMPRSPFDMKERAGRIGRETLNIIKIRTRYLKDALPKADTVRWTLFALMWMAGLWTIVIGMVARETRRWEWRLVS